jgi:hypothetical protein
MGAAVTERNLELDKTRPGIHPQLIRPSVESLEIVYKDRHHITGCFKSIMRRKRSSKSIQEVGL